MIDKKSVRILNVIMMHPLPNNQITFFFCKFMFVTLVCNDILYELSIYHLGYKKKKHF